MLLFLIQKLRMEKELDALEKVRGKYEKAEAKAKKAYDHFVF